LEGSLEEVRDHLSRNKLDHLLMQRNSWDPRLLSDHDLYNYNFLLIDAGHDEANVSKDCQLWLPHAKSGTIVAFDDYPAVYPRPMKSDAHWAVKLYADMYTDNPYEWRLLGYWDGLMVRQRV
jgi:predicted O-methyltransferase YrrM